ncbi:DUF3311 domain-containing protein [Fictibacillus sp. WQ 8-8]|uniref:DUF3311 domain-containing protein n=1 Tax=unclassified Fictibacillus TaxID=2644029 RepID=UPI0006A7E828|nr:MULTISPECIES: DUF3311 domain-containing protein [unclassified Fictibacillus]MCQ6264841.1 DUF3311 domain-containing protein [Fictibacillus sp. WQ 8-8]MED2970815.1 DUF3311 domain-containing protein [Fictibacillus sp. B-59209]UZJ79238.1 DUF3311 domain-containing protein [Fictibacillus sp. KU28468]SFE87232.1 Protein of unknown function [Bacillus sp. OV194]
MKLIHWIAVLPFIGMFGGLVFANKVEPYVLGMPFLMFWILLWVLITAALMALIYKIDPVNKEEH